MTLINVSKRLNKWSTTEWFTYTLVWFAPSSQAEPIGHSAKMTRQHFNNQ